MASRILYEHGIGTDGNPMQIIVTGEFAENSHIWLKALTRSMDIKQAEELLDHYERIQDEEYHAKAAVIVNLVSDVNSALFEQIVSGGERMSEALKPGI